MRLRSARRELYELRFKHAVGQLENSSQISKVRHDIARIMTVIRERDFGIAPSADEAEELAPRSSSRSGHEAAVAAEEADTDPEAVETVGAKPKRTRKKKEDSE